MALARVKVWVAGEILTAADLNGEFNNILSNPTALISPFTANLNANSKQITNLALENLGASPAAGTAGRVWFNTATSVKQVETDDGTFIRAIPTILSTSLTPGDILYAVAGSSQGGNPSFTRLPNVSTSQIGSALVSATSGPQWATAGVVTGLASAWVIFNGLTVTTSAASTGGILNSFNVASILQNSTGDYTINWVNQFSTVNYPVSGNTGLTVLSTAGTVLSITSSGNSTSAARVTTRRGSDGFSFNTPLVSVIAYGPTV